MIQAYVMFASNPKDVNDALLILRYIKETKTSKQSLILLDSENCGNESWNQLTSSFDEVIELQTYCDFEFRCHALLYCMTLVHFDRICLIDRSASVSQNMDHIFAMDTKKFIFWNDMIVLTPDMGTHQNLLKHLSGVEKEKTMDELKRLIIEDFQVLQLDNKFHPDFEKQNVITIQLVDKVETWDTKGTVNCDINQISKYSPGGAKRREDIEKKKHLAPFTYVLGMQGKNFRRKIAAGFNFWYAVNSADMDWIFRFIDLLHNGSLVIDDIQDHSQLRRGKPAAHILYGVPLSINAANYAYFDALKVVLEKSCLGCVDIFTEELINLHHGQGMELYWRDWEIFAPNDDPKKYIPTEDEYVEVIAKKTAGQFILIVRIMRLRKNNETYDVDLTKLANMVGIYFQIRDDLMNLTSQEYTDTKGFCEDISEGKLSFPVIRALNKVGGEKKDRLIKLLRARSTLKKVKLEVLEILNSCGAMQYTKDKLTQLRVEIGKEIERFGENPLLESVMGKLWVEK
ncbi:geranylgeranyl pyrophosphate synthase [Folsomia candida]|uniref:geranylgeranyl pyrophosphate synthase n=1 Tax=Folsomia candida TaxID=158441 RepID=UPI000B8EF8D8|nr:geranylgeranyl pyrophosphate synthase [Folsomia candida]